MADPEHIRQRVRTRLREQRVLVGQLLRWRRQLPGSLFVRFGVCGKPTCACRTGQRHGPYYVLSTRSGGRGGFAYLDEAQMAEARGLVKAYREYRAGMRRLHAVGRQIVTLLRRYQEATAREGSRRVGVTPRTRAQKNEI
ncbi:MAG TPA: DUF6788 family protein [Vicinamibacteria bacterium]|nr:DUF6788 family protein [Vicinamibacteria bacterium]